MYFFTFKGNILFVLTIGPNSGQQPLHSIQTADCSWLQKGAFLPHTLSVGPLVGGDSTIYDPCPLLN